MSDTHMSKRLAELATSALPRTDSFSAAMELLWNVNLINTFPTEEEFLIRYNITNHGLCTCMSLASVVRCLSKIL